MKINIEIEPDTPELTVSITCAALTPEIEKILANIRMINRQIAGVRNGETHLLALDSILYVESVDGKSFLYTADAVYETDLRLQELEHQLEEYGFLRVSRTFLIHLQHVRSLKAESERRIRITMEGGEQIIASRQYAGALKQRLGVR